MNIIKGAALVIGIVAILSAAAVVSFVSFYAGDYYLSKWSFYQNRP